jgi:4-alpha-glucanotransferase
MDSLIERAARWGIETEYADAFGQRQAVAPAALERILGVLGATPPNGGILPPAIVMRRGQAPSLDLSRLEPDAAVRWEVVHDDVIVAHGEGLARDCRLPDTLSPGTYSLRIRAGTKNDATILLVAPPRAYQGDDPNSRMWVLAVQLYGVRSHRNWGHGDFTDLAMLIDLAADLGAAGIGLNPLHALFDDRIEQASPYAPNSRMFLNMLYIDVDAIEEFSGLDAAATEELARLRNAEQVDYRGVATLKRAGLQQAFARFQRDASAERRQDFEHFKQEQGQALARFASFEVLRRRLPQVWWEWPDEWRKPTDTALAVLRGSDGEAVAFYEFVQWVADRQLAACQARARARGLPIGLYLDVAVGVDAGSADAWSEPEAILPSLSAGAPPDPFNRAGQNWGIAAFHPRGLIGQSFVPFRRTLVAAMRHAGAIRIDHVLGLNRLFLVPHGASPSDGAYFRFPLEALLAVVAQESVARRCIVIGEDLGTIPDNLRDTLADWGLWSYRVLMFERYPDGLFVAPERYPVMALATFSTHDLPTYAGWHSGHDIAVRHGLGMHPGDSEADRRTAVEALAGALAHAGIEQAEGFTAVARYLAATPSRLVVVSIEDVLGVLNQPNLPGTVDEHPNWRQRLPLPLEEWREHSTLKAIAQAFAQAGRAVS